MRTHSSNRMVVLPIRLFSMWSIRIHCIRCHCQRFARLMHTCTHSRRQSLFPHRNTDLNSGTIHHWKMLSVDFWFVRVDRIRHRCRVRHCMDDRSILFRHHNSTYEFGPAVKYLRLLCECWNARPIDHFHYAKNESRKNNIQTSITARWPRRWRKVWDTHVIHPSESFIRDVQIHAHILHCGCHRYQIVFISIEQQFVCLFHDVNLMAVQWKTHWHPCLSAKSPKSRCVRCCLHSNKQWINWHLANQIMATIIQSKYYIPQQLHWL